MWSDACQSIWKQEAVSLTKKNSISVSSFFFCCSISLHCLCLISGHDFKCIPGNGILTYAIINNCMDASDKPIHFLLFVRCIEQPNRIKCHFKTTEPNSIVRRLDKLILVSVYWSRTYTPKAVSKCITAAYPALGSMQGSNLRKVCEWLKKKYLHEDKTFRAFHVDGDL